jgi:CHASE2 domain-containing sensor protein
MRKWFSAQWEELKQKPLGYWLRVVCVVGLGVWAGEWIAHTDIWMGWRRSCYRWLHDRVPIKPQPYATTLVLIGDEEYWRGELMGRQPIHRDYLAKLVTAIAAADPAVIALDFMLRSPTPEGESLESPEFVEETKKLVKAIREVPTRTWIVLPKTTRRGQGGGHYFEEAAVYERQDFGQAKVAKGYISLPKDFRKVPLLTMKVQNGGLLDSFAQAIVRARKPHAALDNPAAILPSAAFVSLEEFPHVSAGDVLKGDAKALEQLAHSIVIVGAHWHKDDYQRGEFIDMHDSPLGKMPGALLHANYVEAILNSRLYWDWTPVALHVIDITGALLVALVFALKTTRVLQIAAAALIALSLVVASIISLLAFASVLDFSIPVVIVMAHALIEQYFERKKGAA